MFQESCNTATLYEASMDVDPERKTSEGTQNASSAEQAISPQQQQKTSSSSSNQSQPKARVRSRKKDVNNSGGQDDSKRRCVSTACIGMCPSHTTYILERSGSMRRIPLLTFCVYSLSKAQIKVRVVQASSFLITYNVPSHILHLRGFLYG